jgi:hypothetical protein
MTMDFALNGAETVGTEHAVERSRHFDNPVLGDALDER